MWSEYYRILQNITEYYRILLNITVYVSDLYIIMRSVLSELCIIKGKGYVLVTSSLL
jgi:hypothetical protein